MIPKRNPKIMQQNNPNNKTENPNGFVAYEGYTCCWA
jgi:hypothetical protein